MSCERLSHTAQVQSRCVTRQSACCPQRLPYFQLFLFVNSKNPELWLDPIF